MSDNDASETIRKILKAAHYAHVTTRSSGHALHSRPLAILDPENFTNTLFFFTEDPSPKTADIAHHPEVNVAVGDGKGHLSFSGTGSVVRDAALIEKFWSPWAESWFDSGPTDPRVALLRVDVSTVEIWDAASPGVANGVLTRASADLVTHRIVEV
ncbi:MAG TPA: pyridoxamine 5'-phosphate oxidase family protein [Pseudolysinimonas sp.]|nr:pyridoxamine 5'-phosphate oxidase family protein [Pseudolysinimonas sp.]